MSEAKKFFNEITKHFGVKDPIGLKREEKVFWYNDEGDCVEFQTENEAIIAERIDDYLTLFRSLNHREEVLGFKIKGVKSLTNMLAGDIGVSASGAGKRVLSVTILLMKAMGEEKGTIKRITGYAEAIKPLSEAMSRFGTDQVAVA